MCHGPTDPVGFCIAIQGYKLRYPGFLGEERSMQDTRRLFDEVFGTLEQERQRLTKTLDGLRPQPLT
jgi:hypothetical protein